MYCPYIATAMIGEQDTEYFDIQGMMIYDGALDVHCYNLQQEVPTMAFVDYYSSIMPLNETFRAEMQQRAQNCGYNDYMEQYLVLPPTTLQPAILPAENPDGTVKAGCDVSGPIGSAMTAFNPYFDVYNILGKCPFAWDNLGFPGGRRLTLPALLLRTSTAPM